MRPGLAGLVLLMGLLPGLSSAQDGLRSASLPEQTLGSTRQPMREDVYRARPGTYRPDRHHPLLPVYGYFGPQYVYPFMQPIIVVQVPREAAEPARAAPPVPPAPVAPPAPYVGGVPGPPRTFYIIPGCYAGDRRPEPESLAPGCSISRLRVVPPS